MTPKKLTTMRAQLRLAAATSPCWGFNCRSRCGSTVLGKVLRPTQKVTKHTVAVDYSTHSGSLLPVRRPCRPRLETFNPQYASWPAGGTAFSTSSFWRSADREDAKESGEEGTASSGGKAAYPERLIIYHAGTGKTTFLACLKVTTLFIFGFFDMIMTPAYIAAGEPLLKTAGVALCGVIPAIYVAWSTSPFVAAIHLHLPPYARWSRAILERFARTAPPNTRLDVTTMSLIGKPRVSSMMLSDLRPASRKFGIVNYVRDTAMLDAKRKWWRFKAVGEFNVQEDGDKKVKNGWVWREVKEGIARRSAGQVQGEKGKR